MTTSTRTFSPEAARAWASRMRRGRRYGGGWSTVEDRDLGRESRELLLLSQAAHDRTH